MGMFASAVMRSKTGKGREEDYSKIYFEYGDISTIDSGKYKGYEYTIDSWGNFPVITISIASSKYPFSTHNEIILPDRNGKQKTLNVDVMGDTLGEVYIAYKNKGDYIYGSIVPGHRYSASELKADTRAYIDALIKAEADYLEYIKRNVRIWQDKEVYSPMDNEVYSPVGYTKI